MNTRTISSSTHISANGFEFVFRYFVVLVLGVEKFVDDLHGFLQQFFVRLAGLLFPFDRRRRLLGGRPLRPEQRECRTFELSHSLKFHLRDEGNKSTKAAVSRFQLCDCGTYGSFSFLLSCFSFCLNICRPVTKPDASEFGADGCVASCGMETLAQIKIQFQDLLLFFDDSSKPANKQAR